MSTDSTAGVLSPSDRDASPGQAPRPLSTPAILALCDRSLGEVGRRQHRFGWLRAPGGPAGEWLPVDAYYRQAAAVARATRFIASGTGSPRRVAPPPRSSRRLLRLQASAARTVSARRGEIEVDAGGLALAACLSTIVVLELYAGMARFAVTGDHWLLAFGLAFDAGSRVLGTIAARRAGAPGAQWACALIGAPAVMVFALLGRDGPVAAHPAPLAGVLSVLAGALILLGGVAAIHT